MRKERGYTLVELSVAMAVGAVVMALVVMFCMNINAYVQSKKVLTAVNAETEIVDKFLSNFVAENACSGVSFVADEDGLSLKVINESGGEIAGKAVRFYDKALFIGEEKKWSFECIGNVVFSVYGNLIKCKLIYIDKQECNLIYETKG